MKYLIPTSDHPYYLWQVLVQAQAFRELGEHGVWVIYYDQEPSALLQAILSADIGEVHTMPDWPRDRSYNSAMKEWVAARFLAEHPQDGPIALYDPDAIPTRKLTLRPQPRVLHGSDTDSYTGPAYLKDKLAWEGLCELVGVDPARAEKYAGIGAQYVFQGMPASFWEEVALLSIKAFDWLRTVPAPEGSNAVQAWCADMFVTQLVAIREGWEPRVEPELSMVWAGGPASGWETEGVFHNAGIVEPTPGHFCKLSHQRSPFFQPFDDIDPSSASHRFVELIRDTESAWPDLCRAFGTDTQPTATTDDDGLDYIRTRTPYAMLRHTDGTAAPLGGLATQRATLLIMVPEAPTARDTTLAILPTWQQLLAGRVEVIPVLPSHSAPGMPGQTPTGALFDHDGSVRELFSGTPSTSSAVLLGTDGWLAGGPVRGTDAIAQFIADIDNALTEAELKPQTGRRALVTFVEDEGHLVQQLLGLRRSLRALSTDDTDLVAMGPADVLDRLPNDIVKIPQRPACDDPVWRNYRYVNSLACLNAEGSERLADYTHLLRTDVDTFIFPGWEAFRPDGFRWGTGGYSNDDEVRTNIVRIASRFGLSHHGHTNIGSTWYGPTDLVRRIAALTEMLTKYILTSAFPSGEGSWPGWYKGVSLLYAGDIAVNHLAPEGSHSPQLDSFSTSRADASSAVHVHCWHTDEAFSKHWFAAGRYTQADVDALPAGSIARLAMEYAFASLKDLRQP